MLSLYRKKINENHTFIKRKQGEYLFADIFWGMADKPDIFWGMADIL